MRLNSRQRCGDHGGNKRYNDTPDHQNRIAVILFQPFFRINIFANHPCHCLHLSVNPYTYRKGTTMDITCFNCNQTWEVPAGQMLVARLRFGLGLVHHSFTCPNCHAKNVITATEFESSDHPSPLVPVTDDRRQLDNDAEHRPAHADNDRGPAPTNPIQAPEQTAQPVHAVVLERGLPLLRDHYWNAETMDTLHQGEKMIILDTWTDGDDTWVQLGPERWALIEQEGQPRFEPLND